MWSHRSAIDEKERQQVISILEFTVQDIIFSHVSDIQQAEEITENSRPDIEETQESSEEVSVGLSRSQTSIASKREFKLLITQ